MLYTVDTELSAPFAANWRETGAARARMRDLIGRTPRGDFGVGFQQDQLDRHGLKGVFFVEALHADAVGLGPLADTVAAIRRPHEVQLHVHTEWLQRVGEHSILPGRTGQHMRLFTEPEQAFLIGRGLENLRAAGAPRPVAFRAGNYGADRATLRALASHKLAFDSSYDHAYLGGTCALDYLRPALQPVRSEGVIEVPVTYFHERPGRRARHLQLCACSAAELRWALAEAWRRRWYCVVIVSHGFELIHRPRRAEGPISPNVVVIRRFRKLCEFLATNRDRFETVGFFDLDPCQLPSAHDGTPLVSAWPRTLLRVAEQAWSRLA